MQDNENKTDIHESPISCARFGSWKEVCLTKWKALSDWQKSISVCVLLPTILVFVYLLLWASPMYVSETKFAVRSSSEQAPAMDLVGQIFRTNSTAIQEAQIVKEFIESADAYRDLDQKLKITEHYSSSDFDWISRLSANPTLYDKVAFWNRVATPVVDPDTGIVTFDVRAYTPQMAQQIAQGVLQASEKLVNDMNERARQDAMKLAQEEVTRAQKRLDAAQSALKTFRDANSEIDLKATASGLQALVIELEGQRAVLKTQIGDFESYMRSDAPALRSLKNKLNALEKQLAQEKHRLAGIGDSNSVSNKAAEFESLTLESEFAQKQLVSAMSAMEAARVTLLTQNKYLVTVAEPTLPDESRYPSLFLFTFCVFLGLLILYGLGTLIVASVREHAGF